AVWAPLALPALPAAMRAFAAFWAWALPMFFAWPRATTVVPASRSLTLRARRDLRRAAAFGWMAPLFAARSRALIASASVACGSPSPGLVATSTARFTIVFAAARRGPSTSCRRSELRTRLRPDGERAPVHLRGVLAKSMEPLDRM